MRAVLNAYLCDAPGGNSCTLPPTTAATTRCISNKLGGGAGEHYYRMRRCAHTRPIIFCTIQCATLSLCGCVRAHCAQFTLWRSPFSIFHLPPAIFEYALHCVLYSLWYSLVTYCNNICSNKTYNRSQSVEIKKLLLNRHRNGWNKVYFFKGEFNEH